jgi:hypothetical protein
MAVSRRQCFLVLGALLPWVTFAQCPNACSQHGTCDGYSACKCFPGYEGLDCSKCKRTRLQGRSGPGSALRTHRDLRAHTCCRTTGCPHIYSTPTL